MSDFDMERFTKGKMNGKDLIISCCNCAKIQDPKTGEWLEIIPPKEVILSHSYCIPCVKELYPEIYDNILDGEIIAQRERLDKIIRSNLCLDLTHPNRLLLSNQDENRVRKSIAEYVLSKLILEKCKGGE